MTKPSKVRNYEVAISEPSGVVAFGVGVNIEPDGRIVSAEGRGRRWYEAKTLGMDGVPGNE